MTEIDNRFWKANPQAIKETFEDVSDRCAVVEFKSIDIHSPNSWGSIDKDFSVGHVFAYATTKQYAIEKCENLEK